MADEQTPTVRRSIWNWILPPCGSNQFNDTPDKKRAHRFRTFGLTATIFVPSAFLIAKYHVPTHPGETMGLVVTTFIAVWILSYHVTE